MLQSNLKKINFCPYCGTKQSINKHCEKSLKCTECNFIFYLNAGAGSVAIIENKERELLVTKRKYDPFKDFLDLPGGFAEINETIEECIKREVKEELNLEIESLEYFCSQSNLYAFKGINYPILDFVFICQVKNFDSIKACDDVASFHFIKPDQLDIKKFGLKSIKKILSLYLNMLSQSSHI